MKKTQSKNRKRLHLAALILGKEFTYRRLEWDDELIHGLTRAEEAFWNNHVAAGIMPPPDGSRLVMK